VTKVMPALIDAATAAVNGISWAWTNILFPAFNGTRAVVEGVINIVQGLWDRTEGLRSFLVLPMVAAFEIAKAAFAGIRDAAQWVWDKVDALWTKTEGIRGFFAGVFSAGLGLAKGAFDGIKDAVHWLIEKLGQLWDKLDTIIGKAEDAYNAVKSVFSGQILDLSGAIHLPSPGGSGGTKKHSGGMIEGSFGEEVPTVLQAGEVVLNYAQQANLAGALNSAGRGGSGVGFVLNVHPGAIVIDGAGDPRANADAVMDGLVELSRSGRVSLTAFTAGALV